MGWRYLGLTLMLLAALTGAGETGVAARVNGVEISNFRLERYFSEFLAAHGRNLGAIRDPRVYQRLRRAALEELIDKELLRQVAEQQGMEVDELALQAHFTQVRDAFPDTGEFHRRLRYAGFSETDYLAYLRHEQLARRMLEQLSQVTPVGEQELEEFLRQNRATQARSNLEREQVLQRLQASRRAEAARAVLARLRSENSIELLVGD